MAVLSFFFVRRISHVASNIASEPGNITGLVDIR